MLGELNALSQLSTLARSSALEGGASVLGSAFAQSLAAPAAQSGSSVNGSGFASFLETQVRDSVALVGKGEAVAMDALQGKASLQDTVNAVMGAEQSFQTMLAIRDKLVSAFQEFSHMSM